MLGLARRLAARGHRVSVLSEPCLQSAVEAAGLHFYPFEHYFTRADRHEDFFEDWKAGPLSNPTMDKVIFGPVQVTVEETLRVIDIARPDALVVDCLMLTALIAGEARGLPRAVIFHMPEYMPGRNRPPGMLGLLPGRNWLGNVRDRLLGRLFRSKLAQYLPRVNAVRAGLDLAPLAHPVDLLDQADLRLIQTHPHFDFPLDPLPANVRYTGPVLDDPDWTSTWQSPWPSHDQRPLVVVSLSSTFQNQAAVVQRCLDALAQLDVRGLVTLGPALDPTRFIAPPQVVVVATAPHSQVFPQASLVVTHAGHGTIMRALAHGLPLLCLPMGRDQKDNAAKVAYHGCGLRLQPGASVSQLQGGIRRLLSDASYSERAAFLGTAIREMAHQDLAVQELQAMGSLTKEPRPLTGAPQTV